jgi:hypothetical protein
LNALSAAQELQARRVPSLGCAIDTSLEQCKRKLPEGFLHNRFHNGMRRHKQNKDLPRENR